MEIDRQNLTKLLEAFVDTTTIFERELLIYQLAFFTFCKTKGFERKDAEGLVEMTRKMAYQQVKELTQASHQNLLAKLPQIVDILDSNRDSALKILREWKPKGPPN